MRDGADRADLAQHAVQGGEIARVQLHDEVPTAVGGIDAAHIRHTLERADHALGIRRAHFQRSDRPDPSGTVIAAQLYREARSEEHTSELQSLMRISYAV